MTSDMFISPTDESLYGFQPKNPRNGGGVDGEPSVR